MKKAIFLLLVVFLYSSLHSQWFQQQTGITQNLYDICFVNEFTGVAVGPTGTLIRTTNGGSNWYTIPPTTSQPVNTVCFPSLATGYLSGNSGFVFKTTNSGGNWFGVTGCGINVNCISFLNNSTGITGGNGASGLMCYTTDGGNTFNPRYLPENNIVSGMHYFSSSLLMVCGSELGGARIFKSTNGATNFSIVLALNNSGVDVVYSLNSIFFIDGNTGFATGSHTTIGPQYGDIYRSTNSGNNWSSIASISESSISLNAIHFGDSLTGFVVGSNGKILKSTNRGVNWTTQNSGTTARLCGVQMINAMTGYICGYSGLILKTTNGGLQGIMPIGNNIPDKYELQQNYPNPFNPKTVIRKLKMENGVVTLKVYNILGKEIATLVNEKLKAGVYEIPFSNNQIPSGVYYYNLIAGDYSETKKMVVIK